MLLDLTIHALFIFATLSAIMVYGILFLRKTIMAALPDRRVGARVSRREQEIHDSEHDIHLQ